MIDILVVFFGRRRIGYNKRCMLTAGAGGE